MSKAHLGEKNHFYGKHHTEDSKKKMSLANTGKRHTEETKRKMSLTRMGHITTEETKQKISEANKGNVPWSKGLTKEDDIRLALIGEKTRIALTGYKHSQQTCENISLGKKGKQLGEKNPFYGRHHTKESREKMRLAHMGQVSPNKGVSCSEEIKQKIRKTLTGRKNGPPTEEHRMKISEARMGHIVTEETRNKLRLAHIDWDFYNEYGCTRSQYPYGSNWTPKLRKQIAERDNFTCQMCHEILPDKIATHHIDYDKNNNESSNLIFLCKYCHGKTNTNRVFWEQYFIELQIARGFGEEQYNGSQTVIDNWN